MIQELKKNHIRTQYMEASDSLGKRIREGEGQRIPYLLVVGDKEKESQNVAVRNVGSKEQRVIPLKEFIEKTVRDIAERRLKRSF